MFYDQRDPTAGSAGFLYFNPGKTLFLNIQAFKLPLTKEKKPAVPRDKPAASETQRCPFIMHLHKGFPCAIPASVESTTNLKPDLFSV